MSLKSTIDRASEQPLAEPLRTVAEALDRMRFGVIQLTVHEGRPVQIDVTEKHRFAQ